MTGPPASPVEPPGDTSDLTRAAPPVSAPRLPFRFPSLTWPLLALALLGVFNLAFAPGFFAVEFRDGRLYGTLIDILNHGSKLGIVAMGMTLVIATGGVDLSVGAVVAIAGAVATTLIERGTPFPVGVAAALGAGLAAGAWNGWLVSRLRIQPIVATLVLMVAGRGIAQLITDGLIVTTSDPRLASIAGGSFLALPFTVTLAAGCFVVLGLATRRTAWGLYIEAVGDNEVASRYCGVDPRAVKLAAYTVAGACAALAGLIEASYIEAADANNAGLFIELDAILAVVIGGTALTGGRYSLLGSLLGALFIQTLTKTLYLHDVSADVAPVPKAIVVILVCLVQSPVARARLVVWRGGPA